MKTQSINLVITLLLLSVSTSSFASYYYLTCSYEDMLYDYKTPKKHTGVWKGWKLVQDSEPFDKKRLGKEISRQKKTFPMVVYSNSNGNYALDGADFAIGSTSDDGTDVTWRRTNNLGTMMRVEVSGSDYFDVFNYSKIGTYANSTRNGRSCVRESLGDCQYIRVQKGSCS